MVRSAILIISAIPAFPDAAKPSLPTDKARADVLALELTASQLAARLAEVRAMYAELAPQAQRAAETARKARSDANAAAGCELAADLSACAEKAQQQKKEARAK